MHRQGRGAERYNLTPYCTDTMLCRFLDRFVLLSGSSLASLREILRHNLQHKRNYTRSSPCSVCSLSATLRIMRGQNRNVAHKHSLLHTIDVLCFSSASCARMVLRMPCCPGWIILTFDKQLLRSGTYLRSSIAGPVTHAK